MRVLHLITKFGIGGAESMVTTLATASAAKGMEVRVLALGRSAPHDAISDAMRNKLKRDGVAIVEASKSRSKKEMAVFSVPAILREIIQWRPDVVHVHTEVPQLAFAVARTVSRTARRQSTVVTVHSSVNWPRWAILGRFTRRMLRDARAVAVSDGARRSFQQHERRECELIYNGVDFAELRQKTEGSRCPPHYLFASRLEPEKGVDTLIEALELLESSAASFEITVMGTGSLETLMKRRLAGVSRTVHVHGPSANLRSELCRYDALVMPSKWEGLSLLAIEALGVGLPVLATSAGGLVETLPPGYPGEVPPGDSEALASLLQAFEHDPSEWLERSGADRAWARRRYDNKSMVDGYARVYGAAAGKSQLLATAGVTAPTRL